MTQTPGAKLRARSAALDRLAATPEFRQWCYGMLDDLCAYSRDEGMLTDFGQGIRAAANHIKSGMLISKGAAEMLADFAKAELMAAHASARKALGTSKERQKEKNRP